MERIALVTGSTNNIGKAIADILSKRRLSRYYHIPEWGRGKDCVRRPG